MLHLWHSKCATVVATYATEVAADEALPDGPRRARRPPPRADRLALPLGRARADRAHPRRSRGRAGSTCSPTGSSRPSSCSTRKPSNTTCGRWPRGAPPAGSRSPRTARRPWPRSCSRASSSRRMGPDLRERRSAAGRTARSGCPGSCWPTSSLDPSGLRWLAAELAADPDFEFVCWVDSVRGVELMTAALAAPTARAPGGRAGRTGRATAAARASATPRPRWPSPRRCTRSPVLRLRGVGGYEGALAHDTDDGRARQDQRPMWTAARSRDHVRRQGDARRAGHRHRRRQRLLRPGRERAHQAVAGRPRRAAGCCAAARTSSTTTASTARSPRSATTRASTASTRSGRRCTRWAQVTSRPRTEAGAADHRQAGRVRSTRALPEPQLRPRRRTVPPNPSTAHGRREDERPARLPAPAAGIAGRGRRLGRGSGSRTRARRSTSGR